MATMIEQHGPEGLLRDRLQSTLLVGRLAAIAQRELERQHPDHDVDHATGHESGAGEPFELRRTLDAFAVRTRLTQRRAARAGGGVSGHQLSS